MRTKRRVAAVILGVIAVAGLVAFGPSQLLAATPSPSVLPSAPPSEPPDPEQRAELQVWLDEPLPDTIQPGDELDVGATVWDPSAGQILNVGGTIYLHAHPVDPGDEPSTTTALRDWPGHYRGTVVVPASGLGRIELGVTGTMCVNDVCAPSNQAFELAGDGPPPDAPITSLAEARIGVDPAGLIAHQETDIGVILTPNAGWASLRLPNELVVRVREPRGPNLAVTSLPLVDRAGLVYAGSVTIPEAGALLLEAGTDADGGDATRFGTSMLPIEVAEAADGGDGGEAPGSAAATDEEGLPPVLISLLVLAAVVGAGLILAGFRSGSR